MHCYLGIDAGTSGIKAVVMSETGEVIGLGYSECNLITPNPGWVEQNPHDWWKACDTAVKQAVKASGKGRDIVGIGFSGQMQGATLLDRDFEPIGNSLIWLDQRATEEVNDIAQRMTSNEMLDLTANYCLNCFWAPKLLWVRRHMPEVYKKTDKVVFTKDYLRYRMTGEIATEVSDASLSFLMDVKNRKWSEKVFERLDLPLSIVPERLLESAEIAGYLRRDIAEGWNLTPGIPVAAGAGDQPAGGVGMGIVRSGIIGSTIGTSGVIFGCSDQPFIDTQCSAMFSMAHAVEDKWCYLGLVLSAGGAFKWLRDTFFADQKKVFASQGADIYDHMTALAAQAKPGCDGLIFLPYLNGEKTPHNDENARGAFVGLSYRHGLAEICRSVMEGVVFALSEAVVKCRETGIPVNEVRVNGGGAKSALWKQMQADIYGTNIMTMRETEGPAIGGAILGAVAAGDFSTVTECCDRLLHVTSVISPNPENVKIYADYADAYRALYPSLHDAFRKQAVLVSQYA